MAKKMMRTLIVGAGGVGGYIAARLYQAGSKPTLLLRERTAAIVRRDGLHLTSPHGDWNGSVEVATAETLEELGTVDLVLIACKAYDLASVLDAISSAIGDHTAILPFLNGFVHLDAIGERFGKERSWGGVAHIAVTTDRPGRILHMNETHTFRFGPLDAQEDDRAIELRDRLVRAGVDAHSSSSIRQDMWDKFVFLTALAGATCLFRTSVGAIVRDPVGRAWIEAILRECEAVARSEGNAPNSDAMQTYRSQLTDPASSLTSSMSRDIRAGNLTEGGHVVGDMLNRATLHGIDAPHLSLAAATLRMYDDGCGDRA